MANSRHLARTIVMQSVFEWEFRKTKDASVYLKKNLEESKLADNSKKFAKSLLSGLVKNIDNIKKDIEKFAPEWPLNQISPVDRACLYLGIYELRYGEKEEVPPIVAINEAIEVSKEFGGLNSGKFINGVLSSVLKMLYPKGVNK